MISSPGGMLATIYTDMLQGIIMLWAATLLFASFLAACAAPQPRARVTTGGGPTIAEAQAIPYDGPKARIAVSSFTIKSAKGHGQMGTGLSDMLTTELFHTNRFIVLERKQLDEVIAEQDLAATGRIRPGTEAPTGEIEGAELLVIGAVTEFEPEAGAAGGGLVLGPFPVIAGGGAKRAHIAIDLRVTDALGNATPLWGAAGRLLASSGGWG